MFKIREYKKRDPRLRSYLKSGYPGLAHLCNVLIFSSRKLLTTVHGITVSKLSQLTLQCIDHTPVHAQSLAVGGMHNNFFVKVLSIQPRVCILIQLHVHRSR